MYSTGGFGQPQYGQPPQQMPQPTGYGLPQLQAQYTGYPGVPQQQQQPPPIPQIPAQYQGQQAQTGFQAQQQPQQSFQAPPQPLQQQQPPPAQPQRPQPTGLTSSQMANSFRASSSSQAPQTSRRKASTSRIPSIRLSFITASDQAKFEQLFKSAAGNGQALSGDQARDLLLRSKLSGDDLGHIWTLSDTTKSGQLLFPEFALAMYLCNLKLKSQSLPSTLPERIKNEVSSMVDIISFGIPDDAPPSAPRSNAPNFHEPNRNATTSPPTIQQPQPQPNNQQLLSQLVSQPTGMMPQVMPQPTGFPGQAGFGVQPTGLQTQATGFHTQQVSAYNGPRPPMPPIPTGFQSNNNLAPQPTGLGPLQAQPTGIPGQWGFVNAPATGLPNIDALRQQMMPQPSREQGFSTVGLTGNATVPWAVTKDEKKIYDDLFKSWDGFGKGYIEGSQTIEIFGQSGLPKTDLERIWTLSDPNNRGRLNLDEFAVAMHLIYRKLNGYPIPASLPPELIPPSTRNLNAALGGVKSALSRDAEERRNTGAFLQPQKTGVSYLKSHSFRTSSPTYGRADATVFRNNDDDIGYKSAARRRIGAGGRSPSPVQPGSPASPNLTEDLSVDQLRKLIKEKEVLLDAIDFRDEGAAEEDDALDRRDKRDADDLYRRIRRIQEDIDSHPNVSSFSGDSGAERRTLQRQLQGLNDRLPDLASQVRRCERAIADSQLELFRLKDAKAHPNSATPIIGTGPGGTVTESDRLKARAKAMMQQRSAALRGQPAPTGDDDPAAAARRLEEESTRVRNERENNERMIRDIEESVNAFGKSLEDNLKESGEDSSTEHERRRWEDGLGVEDEVRDFIFELQRESKSNRSRRQETRPAPDRYSSTASRYDEPARTTATPPSRSQDTTPKPTAPSTSAGGSYSQYRTAEERAAYIKQQAEQRMAERLAALGIKSVKAGETPEQRAERQRKEAENRIRKAEEEDAKREAERQRRAADDGLAPPVTSKARPPPPPSRKNKSDVAAHDIAQAEAEAKRAEQEIAERALRDQQEAQAAERKKLECASNTSSEDSDSDPFADESDREQEREQEGELAKEREAAHARLRALEEQVKQGKIKREEEKKRKQAAQKEAQEKEARLHAQRAEIEAARERERQLQLQLEHLGEESSEDEGPQQMTPRESTPASQELAREATPKPPPIPTMIPPAEPEVASLPAFKSPPVTSPPVPVEPQETKNPFLMKKPQANGTAAAPVVPTPPAEPAVSTNPFHRLTQENVAKTASAPRTRARPEDDEWSAIESSAEESEEEDDRTGGGAKQLAAILFGTMGPPRPLSSLENSGSAPGSPAVASPRSPPPTSIPAAPPIPSAPGEAPPPPPLPTGAAPPPPPLPTGAAPLPPPIPSGGAPPPPPLPGAGASAKPADPGDRSALLGDIGRGITLKKAQTNDRSQSSVAGRVLD